MSNLFSSDVKMIFGFEVSFDMIAFFACLLLSLILLLVLLVSLAGTAKRDRRYIVKAGANTAKIPVKSTAALPGTDNILPSGNISVKQPEAPSDTSEKDRYCAKCGSVVKGKFCAKCGTKFE